MTRRAASGGGGEKAEPSPFERVWALVRRIQRGKVASYGQLSRLMGGRLSPVGVGWALRASKAGAIPWHRVVAASGAISTDAESPGEQRRLLEREGVAFRADGRVDVEAHAWRPRAGAGHG